MNCAHLRESPRARMKTGGGVPSRMPSPVAFPAATASLWHDRRCGEPGRARYEALDLARLLSSREASR